MAPLGSKLSWFGRALVRGSSRASGLRSQNAFAPEAIRETGIHNQAYGEGCTGRSSEIRCGKAWSRVVFVCGASIRSSLGPRRVQFEIAPRALQTNLGKEAVAPMRLQDLPGHRN